MIKTGVKSHVLIFSSKPFLRGCVGSFLASVSVGVCCLLLSSILLRFRKTKPSFLQIRQFFTSFNIWISCQHIPPVHCIFYCEDSCESESVTKLQGVESSEPRNLQQHGGCVYAPLQSSVCWWWTGGVEAQYGGRGVNRKETTHNTTQQRL